MSAYVKSIEGKRVDSINEFLRSELNDEFTNMLYYPSEFSSSERTPLTIKGKSFNQVSFKDTDFVNVKFLNCKFKSSIFMGATFTKCEFVNCKFEQCNTLKARFDKTFIDPVSFDDNFDLVNDSNLAIGLYQVLYKNSSIEHQPSFAEYSLYKMKVAERKQLKYKLNNDSITKKVYYKENAISWLYDFCTGYGLKVSRVFRLLAIFIIFFTAVNYLFNAQLFSNKLESIIDAFYFTCVTVTTLGYGDITPVSEIGKIVVVLEAISGFMVISLLLSAIASKSLRIK